MTQGYQVIARRWRPQQFDELVGQEPIVRTLTNAIAQQRIAHAYLFVGPRGTGKTSTARLFAKALNGAGVPKQSDSSGTTPEGIALEEAIMTGRSMDVIEIDGASHNSVDQVRELRENCQYAPAQCRFKIYIIDEVHMLSTAAFNALLKTLEEPPPHVKFIFATTEAHKVLPTIASRCQRFEFRPIKADIIADKLSQIAKAEKITVEPEALTSIARLANGGMRDAQCILDQMIAFCGDTIGENDVLEVYGLTAPQQVAELAKAVAAADLKLVLETVDTLAEEGRDFYRLLLDLQSFIREELTSALQGEKPTKNGKRPRLAHTLSTEALMRMLDALHSGETAVRSGLSTRINFEVTLFKAVEQSRSRAIDTVIKELTQLAAALPADEAPTQSTQLTEVKHRESSADDTPVTELKELAVAVQPKAQADMNALIERLPDSTRQLLHENFRARFVDVSKS